MARDYTIDPGELKERVTLQSRSVAQDAYGQDTITWTTVATVWARVQPLKGREFFAAAQIQQEQTIKVFTRYRTDVQPTWRLVWQGRAHDITGVIPIGREWVEMMCLQGVKDGRNLAVALETVATPVFSPVAGSYSSTQSVTLTSATSGASIYYTNDGSTPNATKTMYTGAISVAADVTLKAIAIKAAMTDSAVATAAYVINAVFDPRTALWPLGTEPGLWISPRSTSVSFQDSAGTTALSAIGTVADSVNPVCLILDRRNGLVLGPELVTNGDFSSGATGWTLTSSSVNAGALDCSSGAAYTSFASRATTPYPASYVEFSFAVSNYVSGSVGVNFSGYVGNANGTYTIRKYGAGYYSTAELQSGALGFVGTVDNISIKVIYGTHLLQATSAARPLASGRVNLLTKTEDFSDVIWTASSVTVSANSATDPYGATTADLFYPSSTGLDRIIYRNSPSPNRPENLSIYVKDAGFRWVAVGTNTNLLDLVFFDLQAGIVGAVGANLVNASIQDVGNGWYRCSVTATGAASGLSPIAVWAVDGNSSRTATANGTNGLYIWGAQVNMGSVLFPYQRVNTDSDYTLSSLIYDKFDGIDDGWLSGTVAAGIIGNANMDCLIAVRRDTSANAVCGLYNAIADATKYFGMAESASASACVGTGAGTPTVWVDGVQLAGGTAVTRGTLHTALTPGVPHILEFRGLDLSTWTAAGFGLYTSYVLPGALMGDGIELFPATTAANRDKARTELAASAGLVM